MEELTLASCEMLQIIQIMLSCFIFDKECSTIETLTEYINVTPGLDLIGTEPEYIETIRVSPDMIFADINLPKRNCVEFVGTKVKPPLMVFYSSFPEHAVKAFDTNAIDFLLHPISYERFLKTIKKARNQLLNDKIEDQFFVKNCNGKENAIFQVKMDEIMLIKAYGNYIQMKMVSGHSYTLYISLKEAEENLCSRQFCRISKSYIVNFHHIELIKAKKVIMKDGDVLTLSQTFHKNFQAQIKQRLFLSNP